jgi:diguanylate cyclase (GGDEF)-like protein
VLGVINEYFLGLYKSKAFIIKKKSEYLLIINFITLFSILATLLIHILGNKYLINKFGDVIFIFTCSFALFYLKKGKLEGAVNLYIVGYIGTLLTQEIIVNLLYSVDIPGNRVLLLVTALVVGFILISLVSIKRYQIHVILYFSIFITILDSIIIYIKYNGNNFNGEMIINFSYYFLIVLGGCLICIVQFKMNDEAIKIVDIQNNNLLVFAYYDDLTGLTNRKKLLESIDILLLNEDEKFAVFFVDLDNFKNINDNFGHQTGDIVLRIVAERLKSIITPKDILSRIGGDEFTIILNNLNSDHTARIEEFAEDIRKILMPVIIYKENEVHIGASIGISIFPEHGTNTDTLINNADLAMFEVKHKGGYGYKVYSSEMKDKSIDKLNMKIKLNKAMENNEFIAYYQPILDLKSMKVIGSESLIRWKQANEIISPMDFIPIAKKIGELVAIDNWMIENTCIQCKKWHDMGSKDFYISVNTSFNQLTSDNFVELVTKLLFKHSLPAMYLCFEITEDEVMENPDLVIDVLNELKAIGIKIYIDDFGTGYSSLSYVNKLPVDIIKIDMSLIKNLNKDSKSILIVKAIIEMAHNLNIKVVSEGIETKEQLNILKELGCDFIQGYLIGKPLSVDDFQENFIIKKNM